MSEEMEPSRKSGLTSPKLLGIFALAMINVAAVLIIRNFPSMAEFGWYIIGTILFLIPLNSSGNPATSDTEAEFNAGHQAPVGYALPASTTGS